MALAPAAHAGMSRAQILDLPFLSLPPTVCACHWPNSTGNRGPEGVEVSPRHSVVGKGWQIEG